MIISRSKKEMCVYPYVFEIFGDDLFHSLHKYGGFLK